VVELTAALSALYNDRLRLARLCAEAAELASYGPSRPPDQQARLFSRQSAPSSVGLTRLLLALFRGWTQGWRVCV
jgi:hypothetical protein